MPRYDLMHWSQRVRDRQAAHTLANPVATSLPASPPQRPAKPRVTRPKPPRDEDAEHVLRLCREGRLFELQGWVQAGRTLTMPAEYRRTPLRVALETGFHSLVEFLLQHESDQAVKNDVLKESCWRNQSSLMRLAVKHGASLSAVSFQDVLETWDREAVQFFLECGADPITNAPFARALKARVKSALGSFLDCKRARPDLAQQLQEQADIALRQACQDEDLKWVSLLMWLGADPRSKGLTTEDLDSQDALQDPEYQQSALQLACRSRKAEILKRLKPDPVTDDMRELLAAAGSLITTPEIVAYLVGLGGIVNDKPDGGSTVLDTCLRHFGWNEIVWEGSCHQSAIPISRLNKSIEALRFLLERGARWTPNDQAIGEFRRSLYRLDQPGVVAVVDLIREHRACDEATLTTLVRAPKLRGILSAAGRERRRLAREAEYRSIEASRQRDQAFSKRIELSRYDRKRLYEEVWAEPTQKVAQRYGVSDVAIAKACSALRIPKPPRGYWAKKAAGHTVKARPALSKA